MQIYKTFFKISMRNILPVASFIAFAVIFAFILAGTNKKTGSAAFEPKKISISFIDRDNTYLSDSLREYLDSNHELSVTEDNTSRFSDDLFYHITECIVIAEKGFEEKILSGSYKDVITFYENPDSNSSYIVKSQIENYIDNIYACLASGFPLKDAVNKTDDISDISATVLINNSTDDLSNEPAMYFFTFLPYIAMYTFINAIGIILITWNRKNIRIRTQISSTTMASRNYQIILANLTCFLLIFCLYLIISILLYRDILLSRTGMYLTINMFAYMLVCLATAFLIAQIAEKYTLLAVYANVIGLSTSFLCGVFVKRAYLPKGVINFSKCLPTYWYINVTEELKYSTAALSNNGWISIFIQLLYGCAIFSIALVIIKYRQKTTG